MASVCFQVLSTGNVRAELLVMCAYFAREGASLSIALDHSGYMPSSRNVGVYQWYDGGTEDYLIQCDSDMLPPIDILDMVDAGVDLISSVYLFQSDKGIIVAAKSLNETCICGGVGCEECQGTGVACPNLYPVPAGAPLVTPVDWFGTGCYAISRRAATEMLDAYGSVFQFSSDERGVKREGVDINLCRQARRIGIQPYLHRGFVAGHAKGNGSWVVADRGEVLLVPWGTYWRGNQVPRRVEDRRPLGGIIEELHRGDKKVKVVAA